MSKLGCFPSMIIALACFVGCTDSRAWTSQDSWYSPTPDTRFEGMESIPDADVMEVVPLMGPDAEERLREVSCVELSSQLASRLVGRPMEAASGKQLFLLRAVYLNRGTGKFTVVSAGRELGVSHDCMGGSAVAMKRQALVVRLPNKPDIVYVSCHMVQ